MLSLYLKFRFCKQHYSHNCCHWWCTSGPRWVETACRGRDNPGNFATFCETLAPCAAASLVCAPGAPDQDWHHWSYSEWAVRDWETGSESLLCPAPHNCAAMAPAHLGPGDHDDGPQVTWPLYTSGTWSWGSLGTSSHVSTCSPGVTGREWPRPAIDEWHNYLWVTNQFWQSHVYTRASCCLHPTQSQHFLDVSAHPACVSQTNVA